ncbi:BRO1-like domain-containing protein [Panaeolus papilionaceus]|nr:BRO1-like domain-containing protein [Panaeolus papilionaceus]
MYLYELPTTGAISFSDFFTDHSNDKACARHILDATQARANLRGALKEGKRTDHGETDYLTQVIEEYLPHIQGIMNCIAHDDIGVKKEPVFSWRTTLSANVFNSSPRLNIPGIHADYAFTLLTYAFALSNLAYIIVTSVGQYELDRAISEEERKAKETKLSNAVDFLCRASGIFSFVGDTVLPDWDVSKTSPSSFSRPADLNREVIEALAKMSLADAQTLAIRRFLSLSTYDNNIAPGPPLPKSHRPPAFLAKLHIECATLYSSARQLAKTSGSSRNSSRDSKEVSSDLRRYLHNQANFHHALSHKWLGVDAGEKGGTERGGEAVGFVQWAKKELEELKDSGRLVTIGHDEKEREEIWKRELNEALSSVNVFYKYYQKMNDTVHFQPVPVQSELQARIPGGRIAMPAKPYIVPSPAFGPGSMEYMHRKTEQMDISGKASALDGAEITAPPPKPTESYAGAGSYF